MEYLGNDRNIVRDATITMTNVVGSNAVERIDEDAKAGGGRVRLTGPYTGAADAVIDVEIQNNTIVGTPAVSAPIFSGVGNGAISGIAAADGTPASRVVITLESLGTETRAAQAPFQGVVLRAAATGPSGNAITVTVDRSALVRTPTAYSLREALPADANELVGDHWAFGAALINPDGTVPTTAPRLAFGDDPAVLRGFRDFKSGRYLYSFSPKPPRTVPAGGRVYEITGGYTVTITDGVTTESHGPHTTLYATLDDIRTNSSLVEIDGLVINDMRPGGQAVVDVDVWTQAYCAQIARDGSAAVQRAELGLVPAADAPLEDITIELIDVERQLWDVRGPVSGILAKAVTGALYNSGPVRFAIPVPPADPASTGVQIYVELIADRNGDDPPPQLCNYRAIPGANVRNGTFEFTWVEKPADPCSCDNVTVRGGPSDDCLGLEPTGGSILSTSPAITRRLQRGADWLAAFSLANTALYSGAARDIEYVNAAWSDYAQPCLIQLPDGTLTNPAWQANHTYAVYAVIDAGDYRYAARNAGASGASTPTFPTTVGATVVDNAITWENIGLNPLAMWDALFERLQRDASALVTHGGSNDAQIWAASVATESSIVIPTVGNATYHSYYVDREGVYGSTEPTWPTDGSTVTSGTAVLRDRGAFWQAETVYELGHVMHVPLDGTYEAVVAGESGATFPALPRERGVRVEDGTVTWERIGRANDGGDLNGGLPADVFFARYGALANATLAAAGLQGNFDGPNDGDGCWAEIEDHDGWFVYAGGDAPPYMPLQYGVWNYSCKPRQVDGRAVIDSTHEWGITLPISCPESLQRGDKIRITVTGAGGTTGGYQMGDRFVASITSGTALALAGGQSGDDTLVWSVFRGATRLDDYELVTTAPAPYTDDGIEFAIAPGGIPFALGDSFTWSIEGGQFRWRINGGSWTSGVQIAPTVSLASGLSALFVGGAAPSWAPGDRWQFRALALSGADNLRQPTDTRARWTSSTTITITPTDETGVAALFIADHTIPSTATITLHGSDDGFASTPLNIDVPWRAGNIYYEVDADHAQYRVLINASGSSTWVFLGAPLSLSTPNGTRELGRLTKRLRLPSFTTRAGAGVTVAHSALTQSSVDALVAMLQHAGIYDRRRFGIVGNPAEGDAAIVRYAEDSLEIEDELGFQPRNTARRWMALSLELEPAP